MILDPICGIPYPTDADSIESYNKQVIITDKDINRTIEEKSRVFVSLNGCKFFIKTPTKRGVYSAMSVGKKAMTSKELFTIRDLITDPAGNKVWTSMVRSMAHIKKEKLVKSDLNNFWYKPELVYTVLDNTPVGVREIRMGKDESVHNCGHCGSRYTERTEFEFHDFYNANVCPMCISQITTCGHCGRFMRVGERCNCNRLNEYHHDKTRQTWREPRPGDWALEIELVTPDKPALMKLAKQYNWACERDGSLGEEGAELISAAMPYDELCDSVQNFVPKIRGYGWNINDGKSYGIHVSFNCQHMVQYRMAKFIEFFDQNPLGICEFVAGRTQNEYTKFHKKSLKTKKGENGLQGVMRPTTKYSAVNVDNMLRKFRVEVRIFRSTLNVESIIANIQFVKSALEWCGCRTPDEPDKIRPRNDLDDDFNEDGKPKFCYDGCKFPNVISRSSSNVPKVMVEEYLRFLENSPKDYKELRHKMARFTRRKDVGVFKDLIKMFPKYWDKLGKAYDVKTQIKETATGRKVIGGAYEEGEEI